MAASGPEAFPRTVVHESVSFGEVLEPWTVRDPVVIGPYHLENASYTLWIEDVYTDYDEDVFIVEAYASDGTFRSGYTDEHVERTVGGVVCEIAAVYDPLPEGDWSFELQVFDDSVEEPVHVFLVRELDHIRVIALALGVVCLSLAPILAWLVLREGSKD
jgi:hypothetical protein